METELVEQLAFCTVVADIITQPVIRYMSAGRERRYTPDVFVELQPGAGTDWSYFLVEVKPEVRLEAWREENGRKVEAARMWCRQHHAEFRIVTEREIRTPFLDNARTLKMHVGRAPAPAHLAHVLRVLACGTATMAQVLDRLVEAGSSEADARATIEQAVANRLIYADLSIPFDDRARISGRPLWDQAPILRLLTAARRA